MSTINVITEFGADPTGTHDSADAINGALNAAGNHDDVLLPEGSYLTNRPIRILRGNIRLRGEGLNKSIILPSLTNDGREGGILVTGRYALNAHFPPRPGDEVSGQLAGVVIDGITINGTRTQQDNTQHDKMPALEYGILVDSQVNDCWIQHSYIHGCCHAGIRIQDHWRSDPGRLFDINMINNIIEDMFGYTDIVRDDGKKESNPGQGLELYARAHDVLVSGHNIRRCSGHGIRPIGCKNLKVENNTISECGENGISVQVDGSGGFPPTPGPGEDWRVSRHVVIRNNHIGACEHCIEVREGTDDITVKNNLLTIDSSHKTAVILFKAEKESTSWSLGDITIIGNTITVR